MAEAIEAIAEARNFSVIWDWQAPSIDKTDLSYMTRRLIEKFEALDWSQIDEDGETVLDDLAQKVEIAIQRNVPNIYAGYAGSYSILPLLYAVEFQVGALVSQEQIKGTLALPIGLSKNVAVARQRLIQSTTQLTGIEEKIAEINRAHEAADRLSITLHDLEQAVSDADSARAMAVRYEVAAKQCADDAAKSSAALETAAKNAEAVLAKVDDAYRAATSQGLAKAFASKSTALNQSMLIWVFLLIAALLAAGLLAGSRFPDVLAALSGKPDWGVVLLNLVLSGLSIAPPVWLAWMATKQIGQRFRLAEDYGYKAALATAYEGYRNEAARLDPLFQAQLFATALARLDELPLRLVEHQVPGSPFHELLQSSEFKEAAKKVPSLKDRVIAILRPSGEATSTPPPTVNTLPPKEPS